jgi:hypothetical protein
MNERIVKKCGIHVYTEIHIADIYGYSIREGKLREKCDRVSTKQKCTPNRRQDLNGTHTLRCPPVKGRIILK